MSSKPLRTFRDCPFCGHDLNGDDILDTLYPIVGWRDGYQVMCLPAAGGCGATLYGDTEEEAMDNWNCRYK